MWAKKNTQQYAEHSTARGVGRQLLQFPASPTITINFRYLHTFGQVSYPTSPPPCAGESRPSAALFSESVC